MDQNLKSIIDSLKPSGLSDDENNELMSLASRVSNKVGSFLEQNNLAVSRNGMTAPNTSASLESIESDFSEEGVIDQLLDDACIPEDAKPYAAQQVGLQIYKHFNSEDGGNSVFGSHLQSAEEGGNARAELDSVFSSEMAGQLNTSLESFGVNIDQTSVDQMGKVTARVPGGVHPGHRTLVLRTTLLPVTAIHAALPVVNRL